MFKTLKTFLSVFVIAAFAGFWAVGQIPGLHVHESHIFVLHPDGVCHHADRQHSDFGGFPSQDSHDENCLLCHLTQGFHSLTSSPVDAAINQAASAVSVFQSSFKFQIVSFDHSSRAPPLV